MITAAALCPAPPLLARALTGADPVVPELRHACLAATAALAASQPDIVVVVGAAAATQSWDARRRLDLAAFAPALAQPASNGRAAAVSLPVSVGLGGLLLDAAGYAGRRDLQSVAEDYGPADCAALGAELALRAARVGLLVMADGSARRGLKAPGYLDERSEPFDATVEQAVRAGDLSGLLRLDALLARELMATGRSSWQVLAGAVNGRPLRSEVRYCDAPFGVGYLVASLSPDN